MAKLYFSYSAMNAGKSAILLQAAHNYTERGMRVLLLTPALDTRSGAASQITSRVGLSADADMFNAETNLKAHVLESAKSGTIKAAFVDEAQFLTEAQVWQLAELADEHAIPVLCYGIRTDFLGKLFPGSAALLGIADTVRELRTICWCGRKATMNLRIDADGKAVRDGQQVEIGGNDRYASLCRWHWLAGQSSAQPKPAAQ